MLTEILFFEHITYGHSLWVEIKKETALTLILNLYFYLLFTLGWKGKNIYLIKNLWYPLIIGIKFYNGKMLLTLYNMAGETNKQIFNIKTVKDESV